MRPPEARLRARRSTSKHGLRGSWVITDSQTDRGSTDGGGGGVCFNLGEQVKGGEPFTFITQEGKRKRGSQKKRGGMQPDRMGLRKKGFFLYFLRFFYYYSASGTLLARNA